MHDGGVRPDPVDGPDGRGVGSILEDFVVLRGHGGLIWWYSYGAVTRGENESARRKVEGKSGKPVKLTSPFEVSLPMGHCCGCWRAKGRRSRGYIGTEEDEEEEEQGI